MDKVSMILSTLMVIALLIFVAPSVLAMNRGKILRNIALWLAIVLGLALIYQNFGPGRFQRITIQEQQNEDSDKTKLPDSDTSAIEETKEYSPPGEE